MSSPVENFMKRAIGKNIDLDGWMTGFVVVHDPGGTGKIGVYIPRIMPQVAIYEDPFVTAVPVSQSCIANAKPPQLSSSVNVCNYLWVLPMEWTRRADSLNQTIHDSGYKHERHSLKPAVNEEVIVLFLDGDIQKGYYLPFAPALK